MRLRIRENNLLPTHSQPDGLSSNISQCHSSRGHSDSSAARDRRQFGAGESFGAGQEPREQAGKDGGWSWRKKADVPLPPTWLWACPLGLAEEQQLPLLCLRLRATTPLPLPRASPDGSLLLQASVNYNLGESDCTFLMPEASQIAAASTVTLKCKPDKICLSLPKAEASQLFLEMLCWFSTAWFLVAGGSQRRLL